MTHDEIIDKWIEAEFIDKSIYGILRNVHYSDALTLCRMVAADEREATKQRRRGKPTTSQPPSESEVTNDAT